MRTDRVDIHCVEDLLKLQDMWRRLEQGREMTVFQSFDWNVLLFGEWKASILARSCSQVSVYVVYGEDVLLIFPVIIQKYTTKVKWFGLKKGIYILGNGSYSDYLNAVYMDITDDVLDALFIKIREDFPNYSMLFDDIIEGTYMDLYLKRKNILPYGHNVAVAIHKMESFEAYRSSLSKHTRQNLRTSFNRMMRGGLLMNSLS